MVNKVSYELLERYITQDEVLIGQGKTGTAITFKAPDNLVMRRHMVICIYRGISLVSTDLPSTLEEVFNTTEKRIYADLREFTKVKIHANIITQGSSGTLMGLQYSTDGGTNWLGIDNDTSSGISTVTLAVEGASGQIKSAFMTLKAGANIENCLLRVVTDDGDGVADPAFTSIDLEFQ